METEKSITKSSYFPFCADFEVVEDRLGYRYTSTSIPLLAALSSSRSVVVGLLVRPSVRHLCEKVIFTVLNGNLNLPTYLPMQQ